MTLKECLSVTVHSRAPAIPSLHRYLDIDKYSRNQLFSYELLDTPDRCLLVGWRPYVELSRNVQAASSRSPDCRESLVLMTEHSNVSPTLILIPTYSDVRYPPILHSSWYQGCPGCAQIDDCRWHGGYHVEHFIAKNSA